MASNIVHACQMCMYRLKPVLVICWKIKHMMMMMMMTQRLVFVSCFAYYNNVSYAFKLPEGPITSHMPKRTADDTISYSQTPSGSYHE